MTDLTRINEYIISAFKNGIYYIDIKTPFYTSPISTPVRLDTTTFTIETNESALDDDRLLEAELDITMSGIIHNNIQVDSKVIKEIDFNVYLDLEFKKIADSYKIIAP